MNEPLLPVRFLYRFAVPCKYRDPLWSARGLKLGNPYRLANLAELEGPGAGADVRAAWSESGLAVAVEVTGKQQGPWCRASRPLDSDGLHLWIDTRNVHNVHRAGRFCHRLVFLPAGGGRRANQPLAHWLAIHRAREQPRPIDSADLKVRSEICPGGYRMELFLPAACLTGFDPDEHPSLGFNYALVDRELGTHTLSVGSPMPYEEDPSLWVTLELVRD